MSAHDITAMALLIGLMIAGIAFSHFLVWWFTPTNACDGWHARNPHDFEL